MRGNGTIFTNAIYLCQGSVFILSVMFSSLRCSFLFMMRQMKDKSVMWRPKAGN